MSAVRLRPRLFRGAAAALALTALSQATSAHGQAIERHLPPAPVEQAQPLLAPNAIPTDQDDHPIGPALAGLVLLDANDPVRTDAVQGVDTTRVHRLDAAQPRAALAQFIGKPLSHKLIAEIEASIARYYRRKGYPFVSVSTPPQVIGGGVLQVRVVEFRAGQVTVSGVSGPTAERIRRDVRLQPDQPVDSLELSTDLDWLNRFPFHHTEAVFSPGDALGRTNLDLQTTQGKPWQVYAGYANSGSPTTGWDRYILGGQVGGLLGPGSLASYQFTASSDFFDDNGDVFGDTSHPRYLSHGFRASIPTGARQEFEVTFDHVETNVTSDPFLVRQQTDELSLGYRTALDNFVRFPGDVFGGLELKTERRATYFFGLDVLDHGINIYQAYIGYADAWSDAGGHNALNLVIHGSPGGLDRQNGDSAIDLFTGGRVTSGEYVYVTADFTRTTRLPNHWSLVNSLIGQYAGSALPDTEQNGVGGQDLVRGYTLDDGSYDSAIVSRNELRTPSFPLLGLGRILSDQISPYAFFDVAYGSSRVVKTDVTPASMGIGADYALGAHLTASATVAHDLTDGIRTPGDSWRLQSRVTVSF
jgi:hemolysin activation/secretion protein